MGNYKKITMDDIAAECGVSKATVSYILNNKQSLCNISQRTIAKVLKVCTERQYKQDTAAVALSEMRKAPLSLLILTPWLHTQFSDFMAQVTKVVHELTTERKIKPSYELYATGHLSRVLKPSRAEKYDAVLVIGTYKPDDEYLQKHSSELKNVIMLNRELDDFACSFCNDEEATMNMAKHIIESNHYKKYIVMQGIGISKREQVRVRGFVRALKEHNVSSYEIYSDDPKLFSEIYLADIVLEKFPPDKTLYFFPQYFAAANLVTSLQKHHLQVPEVAGVATFDNHSMLKYFVSPEITTIDPHVPDMTRAAIEIATEIREGKQPHNKLTQAEFITGATAIIK